MTDIEDRVHDLVAPLVAPLDLEVYDVEHAGGILRIALDRVGGADLEAITQATRRISHALDDEPVLTARYTLEVTTPGLERRLRRPAHFRSAVGREVSLKLRPGALDQRRVDGTLIAATEESITVHPSQGGDSQVIPLGAVESARTVFVWEPAPKPGSPQARRPSRPSQEPSHKRVTTT